MIRSASTALTSQFIQALAIATVAIAASTTANSAEIHGKKECVLAGGEAVMVTRGLAEFMAQAALKHSIEKYGQPIGPIKLTCDDPAPLTHCEAKQRACK